jgi:hypothetical protein
MHPAPDVAQEGEGEQRRDQHRRPVGNRKLPSKIDAHRALRGETDKLTRY